MQGGLLLDTLTSLHLFQTPARGKAGIMDKGSIGKELVDRVRVAVRVWVRIKTRFKVRVRVGVGVGVRESWSWS